jgi:cytochrome c-type biogenesis protein CcmF
VLLGTVFPLIVEAVRGDQLSVGEPYFNRMTMPIGLALLFLMAVAPALPWRKANAETLSKRLIWPATIGVAVLVFAVAAGATGLPALVAFGLGGFAGASALRQVVLATRRQGWRGFVGRTNGGMIVHLGVVLIAVAFAASSSYAHQREVVLAPGETARVGTHEVTYLGMRTHVDSAKTEREARVRIDGGPVYAPSLQRFPEGTSEIGRPSVRSGLVDDVYLALVEAPADPADEVRLRVIIQPLVLWLWVGGGLIAVGSVLAAFPGRRRRGTEPVSAPVAVPGTPPEPDPTPVDDGRQPVGSSLRTTP